MYEKCPLCRTSTTNFLGVIYLTDNNQYIYKCMNTNIHKTVCYFYTGKDIQETTEIDDKEINKYLKRRIKCPRSHSHSNKIQDHEYIYIKAKGKKNRFYCRNHPENKRNMYEFRFTEEKILSIKKLLDFIEIHVDNEKFTTLKEYLLNIYKKEQNYDLRRDKDNLLFILTMIKMPQTIIARIFHTNQTQISRYAKKIKKKKDFKHIANIRIDEKDRRNRLWNIKIRISINDYDEINSKVSELLKKI